jgi:hypothetical protein
MKNHLKSFASILILTILLIVPFLVFAQDAETDVVTSASTTESNKTVSMLNAIATDGGYKEASIPNVAGLVIRAALGLLGVIFIVLMIVAGFKWMSAGGDEKEVEDAQKYIKRAIIGLVITLSSWAIWEFVASRLAG